MGGPEEIEMAYMNQERKAKIVTNLKGVIPKDWKYSVAVRHHSTIVMTIAAAPFDLMGIMKAKADEEARLEGRESYLKDATYHSINPYHWERHYGFDAELRDIFGKIFAAMNDGNHDRSDPMTDYFDVGWYVEVNVGRWDKPFVFTGAAAEPEAVAA